MSFTIGTYYAIRHKKTGYYIPATHKGKGGRGGSHVEPRDPSKAIPRLFPSTASAKAFLGQWLRGEINVQRWDDYEKVTVVPIPSRKKEDLEIIEINLVPIPF